MLIETTVQLITDNISRTNTEDRSLVSLQPALDDFSQMLKIIKINVKSLNATIFGFREII